MLHENMNTSFLMVYTRVVEEARAKRKMRDAKKKRVSNQVPLKFPKARGDRVYNLISRG